MGSSAPSTTPSRSARIASSSTASCSRAAKAATVWSASHPFFDGRGAHGYLIVSFAGLFVQPDTGPVLADYGLENLCFLTPVSPGDELTVTLTCKQITPREDAGHGEVRWDADVTDQDGKSVATYDVLTLVAQQ